MTFDWLVRLMGAPKTDGPDWAAWTCPWCASEYHTLLLNKRTGWTGCTACGRSHRDKGEASHQARNAATRFALAYKPVPKVSVNVAEMVAEKPISHEVYDYLQLLRGLYKKEITDYVRFVKDAPLRHAVFPIWEDGEPVSWHGRSVETEEELRGKHGEQWKRFRHSSPARDSGWLSTKKTVWGLDRMRAGSPVYVCEGIFDALYFPTGVALMGYFPCEAQIVKIIDRLPSEVIIALDRDVSREKQNQFVAAFKSFHRAMPVSVAAPPESGDWGDLVKEGKRHADLDA